MSRKKQFTIEHIEFINIMNQLTNKYSKIFMDNVDNVRSNNLNNITFTISDTDFNIPAIGLPTYVISLMMSSLHKKYPYFNNINHLIYNKPHNHLTIEFEW